MMKKWALALMTCLFVGVSASAFAISTFPITDLKFTGHTGVYSVSLSTFVDPITNPGYVPGIGDKIWGLGKMTSTVDPLTGTTYPILPPEEFTYLFGGYRVDNIPIPGSTYRLAVDPSSPVTVGGTAAAFGIVWKDNGPADYSAPVGPSTNAAWAALLTSFIADPFKGDPSGTIIGDGTPWLTGVLEGDPSWAVGDVFQSVISNFGPPPAGPNGQDSSWMSLTTLDGIAKGTFNDNVESDYYGPGNTGLHRDVQILNTLQPPLLGGYYNRDNDPATLSVIPEPSTLLLMGVGLLGVGGVAWRRKK